MNQEKLIAEIAEDKIRYVIYQQDEKLEYKILKKKISENIGIKQGKILDFHYTANKINQDLKDLEKESDKIFRNISIIVKNQGIQDQSTSQSVIIFNEIEIHLNNNSILLQVMDVIEFEAKTGLIKSIRAYKI